MKNYSLSFLEPLLNLQSNIFILYKFEQNLGKDHYTL